MSFNRGSVAAGVMLAVVGSAVSSAFAQANPAILQLFEMNYNNQERRMPDIFMAGYGGLWHPPISRPNDPGSPGFDVFDRFDFGSHSSQTIYGDDSDLRAVIDQYHLASVQFYPDIIMNHNSGRSGDAGFIADGGYPGFYMNPPGPKGPGDDWGDFHDGSSQSENPGGANYNLFEGDLVSLIDIAQESNNQFIRHPVDPSDPMNIPPGNFRNLPDANNAQYYPDTSLPPKTFFNPAGARNFSLHPFNTDDPMAGDPYPENATGLLMRWSQMMLDVYKVDGFRLDAAKHIPQWFWNEYWDAAVFDRRVLPDGSTVTPFSFVESVAADSFTLTYTRKDGFGNRDALDLNGAGSIRDLINASGFGNWNNPLNASIDTADNGFNDGSVGVHHIYSHDNGSTGDGGSAPPVPGANNAAMWAWAYALLRSGPAVVYHNGREMHDRFAFRGFWPREGNPNALGLSHDLTSLDSRMTTLTTLRNQYARGEFDVLVADGDTLVFQRRTNLGGGNYAGNLLVGCNDRGDSGFDSRTVFTSFPQGTRLHELTGNASSSVVDPFNDIADVLVVGAFGQVDLRVPRNTSASGTHYNGYVVYGPAVPTGTLSVTGVSQTLPPDGNGSPTYSRRLTPIDVVTTNSFDLELVTTKTDPLDSNWDDTAIFRINEGYMDFNGSGSWDVTSGEFTGFEGFADVNQPIFGTANATGLYRQTIDTTNLPEGYNYISTIAFRHRTSGDTLYGDFRKVIYLDRTGPDVALIPPVFGCGSGSATLRLRNEDRTATEMHVFVDLPEGAPIPALTSANRAFEFGRQEWLWPVSGLSTGTHSITVVALEEPAGSEINRTEIRIEFVVGAATLGDINLDGVVDVEDVYAFEELTSFLCEADMDSSGVIDEADRQLLLDAARVTEPMDIVTP